MAKRPTRVLLTVPHLRSVASPYRETMSIASRLPGNGYSLTICSLRNDGVAETAPALKEMGVETFVARFRPRGHTPKHIVQSLRDQPLIASHGPFDIQHAMDYSSSPFEACMARAYGRRFVFNQRNLGEDSNHRMLWIKARLAHRIVAISDSVLEALLQVGAPKANLRMIYNGIDMPDGPLAVDRDRQDDGAPVILCVGQIVRRKQQADAIRAVATLKERFPRIRLDIVGMRYDPDYQKELEGLVETLGVTGNVRLMGERNNVIAMMQQSDVLIHCANSEAFGWSIVEAMSVGLPVVASTSQGPAEIIRNTGVGVLVPIGDVAGFASELAKLLEDRSEARAIGLRAREMVMAKFSEQEMVDQYCRLFREITR